MNFYIYINLIYSSLYLYLFNVIVLFEFEFVLNWY